MSEKIVSPGVFTNEIDASFLPEAVGDIGAVVVGPTVKGPALSPTVVNTYSEYVEKFGDVFESGSSYYQYLTSHTAKNYLENAGTLTVVRIMGSGYSHASATISSSIDPAIVGGGTKASASIVINNNNGFRDSATGSGSAASCSIGGVSFVFVSASGEIGNGGKTSTSTKFFVPTGSNATATALAWANVINNSGSVNRGGSHDGGAIQHSLRFSASNQGSATLRLYYDDPGTFGQNLTGTPDIGSGNSPRSGGFFEYNVAQAGNPLGFTPTVSSSIISGTLSASAFQGGHDFGYVNEADAYNFKNVFKLHTRADGAIMNSVGPIGSNNVLVSGSKNNLRYEIGSLNKKKGTFSLLIRRGDDSSKRKQVLENFSELSLDPNANNYIAKVIGDARLTIGGTASDPFLQYVGDYPNQSNFVRVEVLENTIDYLDENGGVRVPDASASLPAFHSGSNSGSVAGAFSGGTDGTVTHPINFNENISDTNTQGFNLSVTAVKDQYLKALNLLSNADEYDFNLMFLPGIIRSLGNHTSLVTKAIDVCENRGDAFVVVDTVPYQTTTLSTVTNQAKAIDSNYAATYWPWVKVPDNILGKTVWVPPSTAVAGVYSFNDKVGFPWFAPAGLTRGGITTAVQTERPLTLKNRDTLYEKNVNPIATFPGQGVCVWGQKTLQKKSSALDRVNVRRLMIKVKKFISASSRFLVFEQNNAQTRQRFLNIANPFLEQVQSQSGITAFRVVMDESNNTPDVIDRNQLYGQVFLQPTRTAEFIVLDFTVMATGAAFPE